MKRTKLHKKVSRVARRTAPRMAAQALAQGWLLRGLLGTRGWKRLAAGLSCEDDDEMAEVVGYASGLDLRPEGRKSERVCLFLGLDPKALSRVSARRVPKMLRGALTVWARKRRTVIPNLAVLTGELGLSEIETALVVFGALAKQRGPFRDGLGYLGYMSEREEVTATIAACLGVAAGEVSRSLGPKGTLAVSGLMALEAEDAGCDVDDWIEILPGLGARLFEAELSAASLLSAYVKPQTEPARLLEDFPHLGAALEVMRPLLDGALGHQARGVNLLVYGPPGTGKTALARALAPAIGARLLEVSVSDEEGAVLDRSGRIKALRLVGRIGARGTPALILFDEIEDYFGHDEDRYDDESRVGPGKGFTVELLEGAPAPTIWVTNEIRSIDPALLRRFSYILEVGPPPAAVRARIAAHYLTPLGLAEHALARRLAAQECLVPGLIAQAASSVTLAGLAEEGQRARMFEHVLNGHLQALGRPVLAAVPEAVTPYALTYLNAAADLPALKASLARRGRGRLLFYGPPGTGKTALARHLADHAGVPLLAYRASDLLSPYVGEAEQQIAAMFARARTQGALLLLDECDSLLRSREQARQSWEVTQVNEMLTQMEAFDGIFVATTNLLDDLDEAAFRRFDVKLKLAPLMLDQACALFRAVLGMHSVALPEPMPNTLRERLAAFDGLTPGDFAAALRGLAVKDQGITPESLWEALAEDAAPKPSVRAARPMGFMARLNATTS